MLTSKRFYFIKAWYEWITDNKLTPHIIVDAQYPGVKVPEEHIENGRITLNVSPEAVAQFSLKKHRWEFEADFEEPMGVFLIVVPIKAIVAIYAQENKQGAFFLEEEDDTGDFETGASEKTMPAFTVVEE